MIDLAYVLGTVAFFLVMLGYVQICARLGQHGTTAPSDSAGQDGRRADERGT